MTRKVPLYILCLISAINSYAQKPVAFGYDASGNRGVGCGLGNVCKTRDGEPLGGRANAESDFAGLEQAAPQQPQNYAAPQQGVNPLTGQPW